MASACKAGLCGWLFGCCAFLLLFGGRNVQDSCVTVKIPLRLYFLISFSLRPRNRLRSSFAVASAWQRWWNSHIWQWLLSIRCGGVSVLWISLISCRTTCWVPRPLGFSLI